VKKKCIHLSCRINSFIFLQDVYIHHGNLYTNRQLLIDTSLPPTRRQWKRVRLTITTTTSSLCMKEKREREREREKAENCIRTFIIDFCLFGGVVVLLLVLLLLMVMSIHWQDKGVFFPSFFFPS
jgi:hypothetical protein